MEKSCLLDTREIARQRDRQGVSNGGLRPSVRSNTCSFILIILLQGQTEHLRRRECLTQCKIWDTRSYKAKQDICSFSEYLGRATVKLLQNRNAQYPTEIFQHKKWSHYCLQVEVAALQSCRPHISGRFLLPPPNPVFLIFHPLCWLVLLMHWLLCWGETPRMDVAP